MGNTKAGLGTVNPWQDICLWLYWDRMYIINYPRACLCVCFDPTHSTHDRDVYYTGRLQCCVL